MSLRQSNSWLGSLAQPSTLDTKFSTVALGGSSRSRPRPGLFAEDLPSGRSGSPDRLDEELQDIQGLGNVAQVGWSVTLAEGPKARSRARKPDPTLTVYVSTPTSSLTLSRKLSEVVDFVARLRAQFPGRLPSRKSSAAAPPATPKKRNNVLASLTRTLSPRRSGPTSFTSFGVASKETRAPAVDNKELASVLTKASHDASIRTHAAWKSFFAVRQDDLESARIERRIKRARSDQTLHLASTSLEPVTAPLETVVSRSTRQDASNGTGTSASVMTDEVIKTPDEHRLSLFGLPEDPSMAIKVDTPDPAVDVELDDEERRKASSPSAMSGVTPTGAPEPVAVPPDSDDEPIAVVEEQLSSTAYAVAEEQLSSEAVAAAEEPQSSASSIRRDQSEQQMLSPPSADVPAMSRSLSDLAMEDENKPAAVSVDSFDIIRVLGRGCAGKVLLVKEKTTSNVLALKAITKRHVLAHRELLHTRTEQRVLKTCARDQLNPFVVKLHYSFHDKDTLYLALDFQPGGDLATQLSRFGRLGRDRARFYMAEICEGVEGLHRAGIIYRDLKPENVLISHDGHIVLTDFGLSKAFDRPHVEPPSATLGAGLPRPHWLDHPSRSASTPPASSWLFGRRETTTSFCGTAEYLAPEVLLGEPYSYEVDTWSAGTMLYEMLSGLTPFWAENHADMYRRVLHDELTFDDPRVFDDDTKAIIRGMLQRDPLLRMSDARIKRHKYFNMIDWDHIYHKRYVPPFIPALNPLDPTDVSQFDDVFLSMPAQVKGDDPEDEPGADRDAPEGEPQPAVDEQGVDVFDGYSYFGRDSASIHRQEMQEVMQEDEQASEADEESSEVEESPMGSTEPASSASSSVAGSSLLPSEPAASGGLAPEEPVEDIEPRTLLAKDEPVRTSTPPPAPHLRAPSSDADTSLEVDGAGDLTISSITSTSTTATTVAEHSPTLVRSRLLSSRSNLEPLAEERVLPATSTEILVEEPEEPSDSEWDVVETSGVGMSVRNGGREATFFSRGIKDRYKLVLAPLGSPLRPTPTLRPSRQNSRKGSSTSVQSLSLSPSPSTTPEPNSSSSSRPVGALRRFASARSSTGASGRPTGGLRSKKSQRSLGECSLTSGTGSRTAPPSPRADPKLYKQKLVSSSSANALADSEATPRKAGHAIKKLAKSALLSSSSNKA
ncbi:hypothetical protein JCM10213_001951 [Rhodosporidiobolus nylandii]